MTQSPLIWINLQGADWALVQPLLDAGAMPRLTRLIETGSIGKLFSGQSLRFPTAITSLATGTSAQRHGVVTPLVGDARSPVGVRTVDRRDLKVPPIWEIAASTGVSAGAVGWPVSYPTVAAENLLVVSDGFADAAGTGFEAWGFDPQTVSDARLHAIFQELRLHPADISAEMVIPFLDKAETIDARSDERLVHLARVLARTLTLHGAATWIAEHRKPQFLAINFDLVDFVQATFLQYCAPRMGHVTHADLARFSNVVDGAYRMFDMMLARYLDLSGEGTRVVITSDHGHLNGALRKRPAEMRGGKVHTAYRDPGILCATGSGIPEDRLIFGAMQSEVAPTLLALLGCSPSLDMEGQPIADLVGQARAENTPLACSEAICTPSAPTAETVVPRLLAWVRAGYLPDLSRDRDAARERAVATRFEALAELSITASRHQEALDHLAALLLLEPGNIEGHVLAAQCHVALGHADEAEAALDAAESLGSESAMAGFLSGRIARLRDDRAAAAAHFAHAVAQVPKTAEGGRLLISIGWAQLGLSAHDAAAEAFELALTIDASAVLAFGGLGAVHLNRRNYAQALSCFQSALAGAQRQPKVQARRGFALLGLGRLTEARSAFETALTLSPGLGIAQDGLRKLDQIATGTAIEGLLQNWRTAEMET